MIRPVHLAALAAAFLVGQAPSAHAETQEIGVWEVGSYNGPLPTRCLMRTGSDRNGHLVGYVAPSGLFQLGFQSKRLKAAKAARDGTVQPELLFDGKLAPVFQVTDMAPDTVLFAGLGAAEEEDSIGPLVETSRVARVRGRGLDVGFALQGAARSLAVLRDCDKATRPQVAASDGGEEGVDGEDEEDLEAVEARAAQPNTAPDGQRIGAWTIRPWSYNGFATCVMSQKGSGQGGLVAYRKPRGMVDIGVLDPRRSFTADAATESVLSVDGDVLPYARVEYIDTHSVLLSDLLDRRTNEGKDSLFETARTLSFAFGAFESTFDLRRSGEAMQAMIDCSEAAEREAEAKQAEQKQADNAAALSHLGDAMRGVAGGKPKIAEFRCELSGYALTGIVNPSGDARTVPITLSVAEDGSAFLNGATLAPAQVERGGGNDLVAIAYPFDAVYAALNGNADPLAVYGAVNPSEAAGLKAFGDVVKGMMSMAMGGRQRFMVVSLAQDSVLFFDLTPSGDTANRAAPDCVRTM